MDNKFEKRVLINKNELTSFMKNIGLIGGLLMLYK